MAVVRKTEKRTDGRTGGRTNRTCFINDHNKTVQYEVRSTNQQHLTEIMSLDLNPGLNSDDTMLSRPEARTTEANRNRAYSVLQHCWLCTHHGVHKKSIT